MCSWNSMVNYDIYHISGRVGIIYENLFGFMRTYQGPTRGGESTNFSKVGFVFLWQRFSGK